jgi:hypothetical protein
MKILSPRSLFVCLALLLAPAMAAAADLYLKITGADGSSRVVRCVNGACAVDGLAAGKYTVQVCDAKGVVVPTDLALEYAIVSPRDAASGLPTGKRQHQPIRITKDVGAARTNELQVAEGGSQLVIRSPATGSTSAAPAAAQDHNSSRSNKSSN